MKRTIAAALFAGLLLCGCQMQERYYRVTDPGTGRVYYTTSRESGRLYNGAISFRDANTDSRVTLQNSEVKEVGQGEYIAHITQTSAPKGQ